MRGLSQKTASRLDKGLSLHKQGDFAGALKLYDSVLKKHPSQPDALWLKGTVLFQTGQIAKAITVLELAVKRRSNDAAIWNDLGIAYEAVGERHKARAIFQKSADVDPTLAPAQVNLARHLIDEGELVAALSAADAAITSSPQMPEAHNIKGNALRGVGRLDEALKAYAVALMQEPGNAEYICNKGLLQHVQGDIQGAITTLERAIASAHPSSKPWADATMTIGLIAAETNDFSKAQECYSRVLEVQPGHSATLNNRGELQQKMNNLDSAEQDYASALRADPENRVATYNLSRIFLLRGRWADGWDGYEARWDTEDFDTQRRDRGIASWDGVPLSEGHLLVWGEQGLGDQTLFGGFIADLRSHGVEPIVEVDPRLVPLFQRHAPELQVFGYDAVPESALSQCTRQIPIGSLGKFLRLKPEDFLNAQAYLQADSQRTTDLRHKYETLAKGRQIIGISWHSINEGLAEYKSTPLALWDPILSQDNAFFVSLQYGNVDEDVAEAESRIGVSIYIDSEVDQMASLDDAAAQIAAMDLTISTSNTAVHIGGALGQPVWVLVGCVPEWRWGFTGDKALWYPDVHIIRPAGSGEEETPLAIAAARLTDRLKP